MLQLPILPPSFEIGFEGGHTSVRTNNFGEVTLVGKRNCQTIEITSFFPAQDYPFARYAKDREAYDYVKKINSWARKILRVIITETNINKQFLVTAWKYGESDGTGDIGYTLSLKEYRKPTYEKVSKVVNTTYTVKKKDTLKSISKKLTGTTAYYEEVWNQNKKAIEKAYKKFLQTKIKNKKQAQKAFENNRAMAWAELQPGTKLKLYIVTKKKV